MHTSLTQTTGNLWFVLPRIGPPPGGVHRAAFLAMAQRGLIELLAGDDRPLLSGDAFIDGQSLFAAADAQLHADWIPVYHAHASGCEAKLTWLTPHDERGWMGRMVVRNTGNQERNVTFRYTLCWGRTLITRYDAEPFEGRVRLMPDGWGGGIGLGWVTSRTEFGLSIGCGPTGSMDLIVRDGDAERVVWQGNPAEGEPRVFAPHQTIEVTCERTVTIPPGKSEPFDVFMSVAPDPKAACLDTRYLREQGFSRWYDSTTRRLGRLNASLPNELEADAHLARVVRRNQLFCYFFSLGRTLDTEEICPVTSRSSDYYVSAAYWDRDSLLWAFPTILRMDTAMALEMLMTAFGRQGRNVGIHSRFIDGAIFEPGFELDELCAPGIALQRYLDATGDWAALGRIDLDGYLRRVRSILAERRHPDVALFSTDYLPTDDRAQLPYCIYDNVLVWSLARGLSRIAAFRDDSAAADEWQQIHHDVGVAIRTHGIVSHDDAQLFAWSVDLDGRHRLYDEPPGSLMLLPWLGFVAPDDPVWLATQAWVYSTQNAFYFSEVDEIGCLHEPHPWILAIAGSLLTPGRRDGALTLLRGLDMDHGIACEAVDEQTGQVVSGQHFATCAGFLCNAVVEAFAGRVNGGPVSAPVRDRSAYS